MIRKVLFTLVGSVWIEGVIHAFNDGNAIVENAETGELNLIPVQPDRLKFKGNMEEWVRIQQEAQMRAQQQQVLAVPPNANFRVGR